MSQGKELWFDQHRLDRERPAPVGNLLSVAKRLADDRHRLKLGGGA
jgi:hypothetical protein